jgi:hypothetical protein
MNTSYTLQETAVEPTRPDFTTGTPASEMSAAQGPQESGRISRAELAEKVLKLTGSVRLASRCAHHWHHCGINE